MFLELDVLNNPKTILIIIFITVSVLAVKYALSWV